MITVRLFGMTKSLAGNQASLSLALTDGLRVKELVEFIETHYPTIGELIHKRKVLVSVNQEIAHEDTIVQGSDEVALLPPFAGGRSGW
jgi:molybdopterin converting factor small subunit